MIVEDGFEFFGNRTLVTVFSAPNYCGEFDNNGAIMSVDKDLLCSFEIIPSTITMEREKQEALLNQNIMGTSPPPPTTDYLSGNFENLNIDENIFSSSLDQLDKIEKEKDETDIENNNNNNNDNTLPPINNI